MLGTSMVRRVVVGHVVNPSRFFYVFFCGVFLWGGGGKEKNGNAAFLGGGTSYFSCFFLFFWAILGFVFDKRVGNGQKAFLFLKS